MDQSLTLPKLPTIMLNYTMTCSIINKNKLYFESANWMRLIPHNGWVEMADSRHDQSLTLPKITTIVLNLDNT